MNTKPFRSIVASLTLRLCLCLVLPMAIYIGIFYRITLSTTGRQFNQQTEYALQSNRQLLCSYLSLIDTTARSIHADDEILAMLACNGKTLDASQKVLYTQKLFAYMQKIYVYLPEAASVHIDAFSLGMSLLITNDFRQYSKDRLYTAKELTLKGDPYCAYLTDTHLQYDYNFINTSLNQYNLVFSIVMPVYHTPLVDSAIAKLTIDIPVGVLKEKSESVVADGNDLYLISKANQILFTSQAGRTAQAAGDLLQSLADATRQNGDLYICDMDDVRYVCLPLRYGSWEWILIKRTPLSFVYRNQFAQFLGDLAVTFILFALMVIFSIGTLTARFRPLKGITRFADAIGHGEMDAKLSNYAVYERNDEIGVLLKSIERMLDAINRFTIQAYRLELANRVSQLKIFQAQINPHFLFNTLQCIATSSLEENDKMYTYRAVMSLAQMMRYSINTSNDLVPFSMELDHTMNYVQLLQMRFNNQTLETNVNISARASDCLVPRMILQPLVENAFKHGKLMTVPHARLTIEADTENAEFTLRIVDNGVGVSSEALEEVRAHLASIRQTLGHSELHTFTEYLNELMDMPKPSALHVKVHGEQTDLPLSDDSIGLGNVFTRLLLHYNGQCSMNIQRSETGETSVEIRILNPLFQKGKFQ